MEQIIICEREKKWRICLFVRNVYLHVFSPHKLGSYLMDNEILSINEYAILLNILCMTL